MKKTNFNSYSCNGVAEGCKYCVRGRKLLLFISGKCSLGCWYCSLSKKRKNIDKIWANERQVRSVREMIQETRDSNATSAGITGGDPLLHLERTLKYARVLKKTFGKKFHIHIYLPTKFVTRNKLKKLATCIDEVRFHPEFLLSEKYEDIEKIKLAREFFAKANIGVELPLLPEKKKQIFEFILKIKNYVGFVNLNELELSETNFNCITGKYKLKENGYIARGSKEAGLWILKQLGKEKIRLKIHLCTAETKNWFQYKNRLLCHKILPYGTRTHEGTVIYFVIYKKLKDGFWDKKKQRTIISVKLASKLLGKYKIFKIEEHPTYDAMEVQKEEI